MNLISVEWKSSQEVPTQKKKEKTCQNVVQLEDKNKLIKRTEYAVWALLFLY